MSITRLGMRRLALIALTLCVVTSVAAADKETFLNAPAWDLQYELTFTAASQGSVTIEDGKGPIAGKLDYVTSLKRTLTAPYLLDLRSGGPSTSMLTSLMSGKDLSNMSLADQQKFSMDMMSKMEHTANWMSSGGVGSLSDDASEAEMSAAMAANTEAQMATATLEYSETIIGAAVRDEMGNAFSMRDDITHTGSGRVQGGGQITLELDVAASKYMLGMGYNWSDSSSSSVRIVVKQHREAEGRVSDTTITSETSLNGIGSMIVPDDSTQMMGQMMLLRGSFDPADGVIKGEHTLSAHYVGSRGNVPGSLVVKFTLKPR